MNGLLERPRTYDPTARSWWSAGLAVAAVGWGAQQFAPLLPMYQARLGLPATTAQATFALYVLGLVPGLLLGGPVSDRYGRRRVMVPTLAASTTGTVLLILGGTGVGWLFAGRLVAGAASGAAFSSGAAWIKELSAARPETDGPDGHTRHGSPSHGDSPPGASSCGASRPDVSPHAGSPRGGGSGARRLTVAMSVGFGVGPMVAGVLAQWAPAPAVLPYLPHLVLAVAALALVLRAPETRAPAMSGGARFREARERRFLMVVVPLAPWVFCSAAVAMAYLPGLVRVRLGGYAVVFSAVVTLLTAGAGILVQPLARRVSHLLGTALGIVVAGMLVAALAAAVAAPALVVVAAVVLGAGYGCCLVYGLLEVQRMASPGRLAGLTAIFQAVSYAGFAAPYPLAALDRTVPAGYLLLGVAALAAGTLLWTSHQARKPHR